jgi:hypothetical protein
MKIIFAKYFVKGKYKIFSNDDRWRVERDRKKFKVIFENIFENIF